MAFKGGVVLGTISFNATGSGNTAIASTSNTGTVSIGNASLTALNIIAPTNVNVTGALNTAIGSTSNTGTVAIGNTNSTSVTIIGPVNINTSSTNNTAIGSTSNSGTISIGNTSSGVVSIDCGTAGIIVGTTANAHTSSFGSSTTTSTTNINCGTGGCNVGTSANAHATILGSTTASATTTIQGPSAGVFAIGVQGVAVANKNYVTINTSTGALGSDAGAASSISITGDSGGALTGNAFTFTGGSTGLTFAGAGSTETLGGTLAIANGGTNATSMATSTGIVKYDGTRLVTSSTAKIDSSNIMTNTSQPAFRFYNLNNITSVTGDATPVTVTFDTQSFQQGSNFASNTFTAPVAGIYFFITEVTIYNLGVAHTEGILSFICSNTAYNTNQYINTAVARELGSGNNIYSFVGTQMASLAASATMSVQVNVTGGTKTVNIIGSPADTYFAGYLVC